MLKTDTIVLRQLEKSDLRLIQGWMNDLDIKNLASYHPFPVSDILIEKWFLKMTDEDNNTIIFIITKTDNNTPIGFIHLKNINWVSRNCVLGIVIGDENIRGQGIGSKALNLIIEYAKDALNLKKIIVEIVESNQISVSLFKGAGFSQIGLYSEHVFFNGKYHNVHILEKLL